VDKANFQIIRMRMDLLAPPPRNWAGAADDGSHSQQSATSGRCNSLMAAQGRKGRRQITLDCDPRIDLRSVTPIVAYGYDTLRNLSR
jgi:hypothetical protein